MAFGLEAPSIGISDSSAFLVNGGSNAASSDSNVSAGAPSVGNSETGRSHTKRFRTWHMVATVIKVLAYSITGKLSMRVTQGDGIAAYVGSN